MKKQDYDILYLKWLEINNYLYFEMLSGNIANELYAVLSENLMCFKPELDDGE